MALRGADVVRKHQSAIGRCYGKTAWDMLECIVDEMHAEYKGIPLPRHAVAPPMRYR